MANDEASTSRSNLVHEVHDNFDYEQKIFDIDTCNANNNSNNISINSLGRRVSIDNSTKQILSFSNSPTGPSFFKPNFDENGYVFDGIKIDIEDIDNTSVSNITTQSLKRCKSQVLRHYYSLLCFIGWRPFYKEHYYRTPWFCQIFNVIYPLFIVTLLFYSYAHDVKTCQGKLNVYYDTQTLPPATLAPALTRTTTKKLLTDVTSKQQSSTWDFFSDNAKGLGSTKSSTTSSVNDKRQDRKVCGHIVTTYIIPSLLHLIAYILGFIYFRINENEQLYALMEKVFLAVNQTLKVVSQDKVIVRLRIFIILGLIWIVMAGSTYLMSTLVFDLENPFFEPKLVAIFFEVIALIIVNSIYLAVVINHATQCEMIIFYVNEIRTRLEEKSVTIKEAMQQILDIRLAIGNLNSTVTKMATLVNLNFLTKFIIGLIILIMNKDNNTYVWIYRGSYVLSWFLILTFTLIQVARLNSVCSKFKQIALSSRVYGYHASSRDELDSFLLFISNANLRAKLFGVPLRPSVILAAVITITLILIILFQTSVINSPNSII